MKKKKRNPLKQSLSKNIALFFLSLGILAGASILFSTINTKADFPISLFQNKETNLASKSENKERVQKEPKTQKGSTNPFEYSFYDILSSQNPSDQNASLNLTIQIGVFRSYDQALSFANSIKQKNNLICTVVKKGQWSCVRWGNFTTRESAEKNNKKLSQKLQRECMIVNM